MIVKLLSKKVSIGLCLTIIVSGCYQPKNQAIEPKLIEILSPNNSWVIKIDSIKIDSIKIPPIVTKIIEVPKPVVVNQDSVKKVVGDQSLGDQRLGDKIFEFYAITPPDISFSFPSHSIVMIPVTYVGIDKGVANSFCEYWLYTKDGKLICYCKNTMSGLHPVYANSFNPNNHLPEFTQKIGYGEYRLVYKNISKVPVRQDLIFGQIINENKDQIDTKVDSGETKEFWIKVFPTTSSFKLNNNNKVAL
jgi:hypothetical protein